MIKTENELIKEDGMGRKENKSRNLCPFIVSAYCPLFLLTSYCHHIAKSDWLYDDVSYHTGYLTSDRLGFV